MPDELDCLVRPLIGYDCAGALKSIKVVAGEDHDPFAVKTKLGWCIVVPTTTLNSPGNTAGYCHRISLKEIPPITPISIIRALEMNFLDTNPEEKTVLREDIKFLQILNREILYNNKGHLEMPLPFRVRPHLPKDKHLVEVHLEQLKAKVEKHSKFGRDYTKFMEHIFNEGDAEEVCDTPEDGSTWYIPHHGVYHLRNPPKLELCSIALLNSGSHHWMTISWQGMI